MKLFSINILYKGDSEASLLKVINTNKPTFIGHFSHGSFVQTGFDLSSISFFQRGTAQDFITFTSKILVERTSAGARQSVKEAEYMCHVFVRADGLAAVAVSDHEYPPRVAHTMLTRVCEDFAGVNIGMRPAAAVMYCLYCYTLPGIVTTESCGSDK